LPSSNTYQHHFSSPFHSQPPSLMLAAYTHFHHARPLPKPTPTLPNTLMSLHVLVIVFAKMVQPSMASCLFFSTANTKLRLTTASSPLLWPKCLSC
jgi:hypothetical protein